jgi:hypothetical protein
VAPSAVSRIAEDKAGLQCTLQAVNLTLVVSTSLLCNTRLLSVLSSFSFLIRDRLLFCRIGNT